jgi:DNA-binding NtrC family response regulator
MMDDVLSGRRILAVEDDMLIRLTLEDMLAELGCTSLSTAGTVDQALGLIDAGPFDAATLDVNLAGVSSYAVADALADHGVPFVFTTGYGAQFLSEGYRKRPILKKPFAYDDLAAMFTRLLS